MELKHSYLQYIDVLHYIQSVSFLQCTELPPRIRMPTSNNTIACQRFDTYQCSSISNSESFSYAGLPPHVRLPSPPLSVLSNDTIRLTISAKFGKNICGSVIFYEIWYVNLYQHKQTILIPNCFLMATQSCPRFDRHFQQM